MALIDDVQGVLSELAPHGWGKLFETHGIDITASDLKAELLTDIGDTVDRNFPGFEDFAIEGKQGITGGSPARSLIFHALASPNVQWINHDKTSRLTKFANIEQLEVVENYVYAAARTSLDVIEAIHGRENLSVVVFANQYRTAIDAPHQKHADLVFSRTGVARVGNANNSYSERTRSFDPLSDEKHKIRVLPAKYNAYIAASTKGSPGLLGKRFNKKLDIPFTNVPKDENLKFWHPVHKLFDGEECLGGLNVTLKFRAFHSNEKIRKIHKYVSNEFDFDTGSSPSEHSSFPFKFNEAIAEFDESKNLVIPVTHDALVSKAIVDDQPVILRKEFKIPPRGRRFVLKKDDNSIALFSSSIEFRPSERVNPISTTGTGAQRSVPEYSHVRTKIVDGREEDINDVANIVEHIANEEFDALHYVDFTGDGFVSVQLNVSRLNSYTQISAYSIIAPPDFFPFCEQSEIFDSAISAKVWSRPPQTLADIRLLPNVKSHPQLLFDGIQAFDTCTALINGTLDKNLEQTTFASKVESRVTYLTDGAAGVFAPGWDTSFDMLQVGQVNVPFLAAYGLGSPFPEDAKLCAAISSFWPAAAPDIARSFWPEARNRRTVIPLTDNEIGSDGKPGWDGENGPIVTTDSGKTIVTYKKFDYVDYTLNAYNNKFDYHKLAKMDSKEYLDRVEKFLLARQDVGGGAILLNYTIDSSGTHHYRFMLEFTEIESSIDQVKLALTEFRDIQVDDNNQVTIAS